MKRILVIMSALLLAVSVFIGSGCDRKVTGPERTNTPPEVKFVNIPIPGAKFSADATIYWYGTDVDGFIVQFRYAVVESSLVGSDPLTFIQAQTDSSIDWIVLDVELNDPQTNDEVKMSADVSDPVRKYVASYVFVQAVDNLGAKSTFTSDNVRMFLKNNHFPNTSISSRDISDPYVNTASAAGVLQGVTISWSGEDPVDYPEDPPPFEYQWKFFGPFTNDEMDTISSTSIIPVFVDIYGDFYYLGDIYQVINSIDTTISGDPPDTTVDTTYSDIAVDTLGRGNPYGSWNDMLYTDSLQAYGLYKLVEESYDPLSSESWVSDRQTQIYDVFRDTTIDTTSQLNFLFWCQARDDSKVPDPVPAFKWVSVIEPKFEREVLVIDATVYNYSTSGFWNWPVFPQKVKINASYYGMDTQPVLRDVMGELIDNWAGGDVFDSENIRENATYQLPEGGTCTEYFNRYGTTQDYYPIVKLTRCEDKGFPAVTLRDILKHKIVILAKDNAGGQLIMDSPIMLSIIDGLNAGMSCLSMVRSPFKSDTYDSTSGGSYQDVQTLYQQYFGVNRMWHTGWQGQINYSLDLYGSRIEDFVGAIPLPGTEAEFPHLSIDTTLLEDRYLWMPGPAGFNLYDYRCDNDSSILIGALPEVGYVEKSLFAEPLYLYESKYLDSTPRMVENCNRLVGHHRNFNGTVVAIRYNTGLFRTSHFSFSFLPIDPDDANAAFGSIMDWLAVQPFIQTGKIATSQAAKIDISAFRRTTEEYHELKKQGLLRSYSDYYGTE